MNTPNIIGKTFGRWIVVEKLTERQSGKVLWLCKCACGNLGKITTSNLTQGLSLSCGCFQKEQTSKSRKKHGMANTRLYTIWAVMKRRCYNEKDDSYRNYGGRGILVCDEWRNHFENFCKWALENGYAENLTIDRIDVNGNYEPSNCRWATKLEQANNKRDNHYVIIDNIKKSLSDWCRFYKISERVVQNRIRIGWDVITALKTPKTENKRYVTIKNETKTVSEWCDIYGIKKGIVRGRIVSGWDEVKAIVTPQIDRFRYVTINGKTKRFLDWCKLYSIKKETVRCRIRNGWNEIDAITTPLKLSRWSNAKTQEE